MSWSIPAQIEKDFLSGKATYQTFQTGVGGQSILPVPSNSYVVIFGYDYNPSGGGFVRFEQGGIVNNTVGLQNIIMGAFATQQISFYTGTNFYPFIHHFDNNFQLAPYIIDQTDPANNRVTSYTQVIQVNTSPVARQTYIVSNSDVSITVGLIRNISRTSANAIPVTSRTPLGITYGGSGQTMNTQTDFGPLVNPQQFMQPSPKDYQDFAFGLLPANADGQAFATPDSSRGLVDASAYINGSISPTANTQPESHYFLCCHYALYNQTTPEKLG